MPVNPYKIKYLMEQEQHLTKKLEEIRRRIKEATKPYDKIEFEKEEKEVLKKQHDLRILTQLEYFKSDYN